MYEINPGKQGNVLFGSDNALRLWDLRTPHAPPAVLKVFFFFFLTFVTGPTRSLSLKLTDTRVYGPQIRARLVTAAHLCGVVVRKLRAVRVGQCPLTLGPAHPPHPASRAQGHHLEPLKPQRPANPPATGKPQLNPKP